MTQLIRRQNDHITIHRAAWRIYRLVKRKRDAQASAELDAMGADLVPVAHALVLGEFRASPLAGSEWFFIGLVLVTIPILLTVLVTNLTATPGVVNGPGEQLIRYFGIFAIGFMVETGGTGLYIEWRNRRLLRNGFTHPITRINEMAGLALAAATEPPDDLVGALLDAGAVDPDPSPCVRRELDSSLSRILPDCSSEALQRLNSSQRRALVSRLSRVAGITRPSGIDRRHAFAPGAESARLAAMAGIAIVRVYETLADESAISVVRSLAGRDPDAHGEEWRELISSARHCLPILQELVRNSRGSSELLRGSGPGVGSEQELLRANGSSDESAPDELLRPTKL